MTGAFNAPELVAQRDAVFHVASALSPLVLAEFRTEIDRLVETGASFEAGKEALTRLADRHPIAAVQEAA